MKIGLIALFLLCFCTIQAQTDTIQISKIDSAVYFKPEIEAMYPGGIIFWQHYLQRNLQYPSKASRKNIQGTVVMQFIVDSTGFAHDFTVISGPNELRSESTRVIEKVEIWMPAVNRGKKVNSWKTQSINYKLEN